MRRPAPVNIVQVLPGRAQKGHAVHLELVRVRHPARMHRCLNLNLRDRHQSTDAGSCRRIMQASLGSAESVMQLGHMSR